MIYNPEEQKCSRGDIKNVIYPAPGIYILKKEARLKNLNQIKSAILIPLLCLVNRIYPAQPQKPALRSGAWGVERRMVRIGRRYEGLTEVSWVERRCQGRVDDIRLTGRTSERSMLS